ncbi:hypothetical protein [Thermoflexus hugenholtzii]
MMRTRWRVLLLTAMLFQTACAAPAAPPEAPSARPQGTVAPTSSPTPPPEREGRSSPQTAEPLATATPERVARQIYTSFRTIPSPCCPPRPLPEVIAQLEGMPGIQAIQLEGDRLIVDYDPGVLSAEDLPVLFALQGLEVNP